MSLTNEVLLEEFKHILKNSLDQVRVLKNELTKFFEQQIDLSIEDKVFYFMNVLSKEADKNFESLTYKHLKLNQEIDEVNLILEKMKQTKQIDYEEILEDLKAKKKNFLNALKKELKKDAEKAIESKIKNLIKTGHNLPFNSIFLKEIDDLNLSVRSRNALRNENICSIGDLVQKTEKDLMKIPNFGLKSLKETKESLHSIGLILEMTIPSLSHIEAEVLKSQEVGNADDRPA